MRLHAVLMDRGHKPHGHLVPETRAMMDRLADLMADGCRSISAAARALGISQSRADQLWQRIRADLGEQAR